MVDPGDVPRILLDAARLIGSGELVVFGSGALAFWLEDAPCSRDVDVFVSPQERGELVEALMGELSWYHERHDAYVEVWGPETFAAPADWRDRARRLTDDTVAGVTLLVPHPHDVMVAKLERWESGDREHAAIILRSYPIDAATLSERLERTPHRAGAVAEPGRVAAFEAHAGELMARVEA